MLKLLLRITRRGKEKLTDLVIEGAIKKWINQSRWSRKKSCDIANSLIITEQVIEHITGVG